MKKILLTILIMIIAFIPSFVKAEVKVLDLRDTLTEKGITIADKNYKETSDQIKIYLFRWSSCSHCFDFLAYLNTLVPEYGHMFKLRSYETTMNADNDAVMKKVKKYFGDEEKTGVPYIVIGESTFYGFGDNSKEKIKEAIKAEYESNNRFDVFEEIERKEKEKNSNDGLYVIIPVALFIIIIIAVGNIKRKAE